MKRTAMVVLSILFVLAPLVAAMTWEPAWAQDRVIKIAGVGAMSGVVRSFGVNAKATLDMAMDEINAAGGIKLKDGSRAKIVTTFVDERCNAEEGISVIRKLASEDWLVSIGPTCSNVAEPLFGILQRKAGDAGDSGLQFPIFTDTAIKPGLAKISEWSFRNVPHEPTMYNHLFKWLKEKNPDAKTVMAASRATSPTAMPMPASWRRRPRRRASRSWARRSGCSTIPSSRPRWASSAAPSPTSSASPPIPSPPAARCAR